jgi:hypothetical protein
MQRATNAMDATCTLPHATSASGCDTQCCKSGAMRRPLPGAREGTHGRVLKGYSERSVGVLSKRCISLRGPQRHSQVLRSTQGPARCRARWCAALPKACVRDRAAHGTCPAKTRRRRHTHARSRAYAHVRTFAHACTHASTRALAHAHAHTHAGVRSETPDGR